MGDEFRVKNRDMLTPQINNIVTLTVDDEEVTVRIVGVNEYTTDLKVVPPSTKE